MDGGEGISIVFLAGGIVGREVCADELRSCRVDCPAEGFDLAGLHWDILAYGSKSYRNAHAHVDNRVIFRMVVLMPRRSRRTLRRVAAASVAVHCANFRRRLWVGHHVWVYRRFLECLKGDEVLAARSHDVMFLSSPATNFQIQTPSFAAHPRRTLGPLPPPFDSPFTSPARQESHVNRHILKSPHFTTSVLTERPASIISYHGLRHRPLESRKGTLAPAHPLPTHPPRRHRPLPPDRTRPISSQQCDLHSRQHTNPKLQPLLQRLGSPRARTHPVAHQALPEPG